MATYNITKVSASVNGAEATLFRVGFGDPAQNDMICRDAEAALAAINPTQEMGGKLALINGPASLAVAVVLAHHLVHRFAVVGVFDPKMAAYVVAASHRPDFAVGDVIPAAAVTGTA